MARVLYDIGETFMGPNGILFNTVADPPTDACYLCDMRRLDYCGNLACHAHTRRDHTSVHFERVESTPRRVCHVENLHARGAFRNIVRNA